MKDSQPNTTILTVPTSAERNGDFSALLAAGTQYQLYDPNTAVLNGTTVSRSVFPGNVIPSSRINPISAAYLPFYPSPNVTGGVGPTGVNNYIANATTNDDYVNFLGRTDYNMSQRSRLFFDIRYTNYTQVKNNYFSNISNGSLLYRENWGGTVDEIYTLTPQTVLDTRINFTRMNEGHGLPSAGFNPTALGFPSYLGASTNYAQLPILTLTNYQGLGGGSTLASQLPSQSLQWFGDVVTVKGNHTLKIGADIRQYRLNVIQFGNATGNFSFGNTYVRASSSASATVAQGQDLATFLLGLPTSGSYDINTSSSMHSYYFAGFAQDDWRVSPTLTVNLGLRFDKETPYTEKYGRTVDGFDATSVNPLAAAAQAAYAKNPISQLSASGFNVPGGLTFASPGNGAAYQTVSHPFSPRLGAAWSPARFHGKTVVRAGFGMFVSPITVASLSGNGTYSANPIINQEGFSASTAFSIPGAIVTPTNTLSNPFPAGLLQPVGCAAGLATFAGQAIPFLNPNMKNPYSLRWNFDVQQTLTVTDPPQAYLTDSARTHQKT